MGQGFFSDGPWQSRNAIWNRKACYGHDLVLKTSGAFTHYWRAFLTARFLKNMDFERIPQVVCRDRLDTDRFALEERVVAFVARRRKAIVQRLELAPRRLKTTRSVVLRAVRAQATRSAADGCDQVGKMRRGRAEKLVRMKVDLPLTRALG